MTREKAIGALVAARLVFDFKGIDAAEYTEAMKLAISALSQPTKEQLERVWCAGWVVNGQCDHKPSRMRNPDKWMKFSCSKCGYSAGRKSNLNFCPNCGRAMSPEALEGLRKRWEALNDESD